MKKVNKEFPVYVLENWHQINPDYLEDLVGIIVRNREKHRIPGGASFWLIDDEDGTFNMLYTKFYQFMVSNFQLTPTTDNYNICNVYYNNGDDAIEAYDSHGRQYYHSHKHVVGPGGNPTTIAGVYYVNIPDPNSGTIDFRQEAISTPNGFVKIAPELIYHQLNPRPYEKIDGIRTTIVTEMTYQPKNGDLVLFPSYLDHRPHKSLIKGHRVAVNFELKTTEHPDQIFESFNKKHNLD